MQYKRFFLFCAIYFITFFIKNTIHNEIALRRYYKLNAIFLYIANQSENTRYINIQKFR